MMPYFIWNGVDSRNMGIWVSQYPARVRAGERVTAVTIPGRAGQLTFREGEAVYEPIELNMRLQTLHTNDYTALNDWLRGDGLLLLGRDTEKAYKAAIIEEITWDKNSNDIAEANIRFTCDPLRIAYPLEQSETLTAAGSIVNSGNVPAKPLITIAGSGDITLTIGETAITIKDVENSVTLDCDAVLAYSGDVNMMDKTSGDFPILAVGSNAVSWTGTVTSVTVLANRRWL